MTARQLVFDLPVREARGRADLFVSPANDIAVRTIEHPEGWPGGRLVLTGPHGSGKTHLCHVWAAASGAAILPASGLAATDVPGLADAGAVALEDMDRPGLDEAAVLHLYNMLGERRGRLLMTAACPVRDWPLSLPDLQSRLQSVPAVAVAPPDDALLRAMMLKQFADRQLTVSPQLIDWLILRIERSFDGLQNAVEALDNAALSENRAITRALAARVLDKPDATGA